MAKRKMVIALGGNAIQTSQHTAEAQQHALEMAAEQLADLIGLGYAMIISHGNGPQVGNLLLQQKAAASLENPAMPLDTCDAMTQGMIGYWMENALEKALRERGIYKNIVTIVTRVVVNQNDPAFKNPTKPIGPFYSKEEADRQQREEGAIFMEDAGRGWRRVIPSPKPVDILEHEVIHSLMEDGDIVISTGGGGIPVIETEEGFKGVEAVIDKDFASQKLAELVHADILLILTTVDYIFLDFNKPTRRRLENIQVDELKRYMAQGQFAPGSMLPKVQAAIQFAESSPERKTIITSLDKAFDAVNGRAGTVISLYGSNVLV